ncbi:MAG TPA: 30S ribosomal protein S3ae [Methanoregulaceae archaeon]|nr:30S ribosomal protein S3ae [Methanoregulaceae archaeon]
MARKKQAGRRVEGWKAKTWYKVNAPETFNSAYIGDTISADTENLIGRIMNVTLGEINSDYGKQHVKMKFRINRVAGDAAYTEFVGHELTKDYLRSLVKRRSSRIDSHVIGSTKDGFRVHLTVTCYTLMAADMSQIHEIRKRITGRVSSFIAGNDWQTVTEAMVTGTLAREMMADVREVFPVRRIEVIKSKLLGRTQVA